MIACSLFSFIAGFQQMFSQSSGPRRSCGGTEPDFAVIGVGSRAHGEGDGYQKILDSVREFEQNLDTYTPALPEIVDDYFANLVDGAYHEYRSESPDYYKSEIAKYPDRQLGFHKSALSHRLGAPSYLAHHPLQCDRGQPGFIFGVAAADVAMHTGKPDLFDVGRRLLAPEILRKIGPLLVKRHRVTDDVDARAN
jgi:hypothetical protein